MWNGPQDRCRGLLRRRHGLGGGDADMRGLDAVFEVRTEVGALSERRSDEFEETRSSPQKVDDREQVGDQRFDLIRGHASSACTEQLDHHLVATDTVSDRLDEMAGCVVHPLEGSHRSVGVEDLEELFVVDGAGRLVVVVAVVSSADFAVGHDGLLRLSDSQIEHNSREYDFPSHRALLLNLKNIEISKKSTTSKIGSVFGSIKT